MSEEDKNKKEKRVVFSSVTKYPTDKNSEYRFKYNDGRELNYSIPKHPENAPVKTQSGGVEAKGFTDSRKALDQAGIESNSSTSVLNNNDSKKRKNPSGAFLIRLNGMPFLLMKKR